MDMANFLNRLLEARNQAFLLLGLHMPHCSPFVCYSYIWSFSKR